MSMEAWLLECIDDLYGSHKCWIKKILPFYPSIPVDYSTFAFTPDRYIFSNSSFVTLWNTAYSQSITNLNTIIKLAEAQGNNNYKGVALVLRSWVFQLLTDAYGDIPYKQAGNIDEYLTPAYDAQKDVYFGLLDDLKAAQASLDPAGKAIAGDVIYSGKIAPWKKFANSLRLRIALRIADREAEKSKQVLAEIAAEGSGYISNNGENRCACLL